MADIKHNQGVCAACFACEDTALWVGVVVGYPVGVFACVGRYSPPAESARVGDFSRWFIGYDGIPPR